MGCIWIAELSAKQSEDSAPVSCPVQAEKDWAQAAPGGRKRIFLGLLAASCIVVCLLLLLFLILPWIGPVAPWLAPLSVATGISGIAILAWICLTIVYNIYSGKKLPGISGTRHLCIRLFLPLMEMVGKIAGLDKSIVRRSFIKVNNEFVCANTPQIPPDRLLLLLPHCIQASQCQRRLGPDLSRCTGCGMCQIAQIRKLSHELGINVAIASGGTIARRIVAEKCPLCIVAIACERDLTSGIQDSYPIPVYGVLNERPNGPCHDTLAPLGTLQHCLRIFLKK